VFIEFVELIGLIELIKLIEFNESTSQPIQLNQQSIVVSAFFPPTHNPICDFQLRPSHFFSICSMRSAPCI
jgi:hypothetical protein